MLMSHELPLDMAEALDRIMYNAKSIHTMDAEEILEDFSDHVSTDSPSEIIPASTGISPRYAERAWKRRGSGSSIPTAFDQAFHPLPETGPENFVGRFPLQRTHSLLLSPDSTYDSSDSSYKEESVIRVKKKKKRRERKRKYQAYDDMSTFAVEEVRSQVYEPIDPFLSRPSELLEIRLQDKVQTIANMEEPLCSAVNCGKASLLKTAYWRLRDMKLVCRWSEEKRCLVVVGHDFNFATEFQYLDHWHMKNDVDGESHVYPDLHGKPLRTLAQDCTAKNAVEDFDKFDEAASRNTAHSAFLNLKTSTRASVAVYMKLVPLQPFQQGLSIEGSSPATEDTNSEDGICEKKSIDGFLFLLRMETTTDRGFIKTFSMFMKKYSDKDQVANQTRRKQSENRAKRSKCKKRPKIPQNCPQLHRTHQESSMLPASIPSLDNGVDNAKHDLTQLTKKEAPDLDKFLKSSTFKAILNTEIGLTQLDVAPAHSGRSSSAPSSEALQIEINEDSTPLSPRATGLVKAFLSASPPELIRSNSGHETNCLPSVIEHGEKQILLCSPEMKAPRTVVRQGKSGNGETKDLRTKELFPVGDTGDLSSSSSSFSSSIQPHSMPSLIPETTAV